MSTDPARTGTFAEKKMIKGPVLPPKTAALKSNNEPSSKRSSFSSNGDSQREQDSIGEKFVTALKNYQSPHQGSPDVTRSSTKSGSLSPPPVPRKPSRASPSPLPKPPALPPKIVATKAAPQIGVSSASPQIRKKRIENPYVNESNATVMEPVARTAVQGPRDELSRPVPSIKPPVPQQLQLPERPAVPEQLSTESDLYEDVEAPAPEGDGDSGHGSTEGAQDADRISNSTGMPPSVF